MARDQAKTENESVKVDSQSVEEAIERLEKSSASERARIMDKHNADEIDLPIKIHQNRRAKFCYGEYRFSQACKKNDPTMALEAILLEARVCNPDQGHQPGNPQHFQSPDISLDDHWEKTKESARELTAMHSDARWHANKAAQAMADNDTARAVCFTLAASRWVTEMKLLQVAAAELEGQLADPGLYEAEGKPRLLTLLADKQRLDAQQAEVESDWLITSKDWEEACSDRGSPSA